MKNGIRTYLALMAVCLCTINLSAQSSGNRPIPASAPSSEAKPFRILTNGKQVTVRAKQDIKTIMVWTANGHRVLEQKNINASNYQFRITVNYKVFFLRVQLADGNTYSEKIGLTL